MFNRLIKKLFVKKSADAEANYFYFEETRKTALADGQSELKPREVKTENTLVKPLSIEQKQAYLFYDVLFGRTDKPFVQDELSQFIYQKITQLLKQPKYIHQHLPQLPTALTELLTIIKRDDFQVTELMKCIEQDPIILAKVIELANSSYYNRSNKSITELKSAFMLLGKKGLMEGVINGFLAQLTPQNQLYFKLYGKLIWEHSVSTGVIAKTLVAQSSYKAQAEQAYLIGLLCNLGDMIIYQLLVEAFAHVHPDCQPNTQLFKELLFEHAKVLTFSSAKHWHFPDEITSVLALQVKLTKSTLLPSAYRKKPLSCYIYEANILSELSLMLHAQLIDQQQYQTMASQLIYSAEAKQYLANQVTATVLNEQ